MLISKNWIQEYFKEKLPRAKEIADVLTMKAFEVEDFETKGGDETIDVDILPNRAHDCLSHKGIAKEVAIVLNKNFIDREIDPNYKTEKDSKLNIKVDDPKLCLRYIGRKIENIEIKSSPDWLREKLEVLGERSINNVVDITNYIMLDQGQPMHAFDSDKVKGDIHVRLAKEGEKIELLDGKVAILDENMLLIADDEGPLAIAGIKGGKRAEVIESTRNIILESANFNRTTVRKTSQKLDIKNNSSKRFENEISPEIAEVAMEYATSLIYENCQRQSLVIYKTENFYPTKATSLKIETSLSELNKKLGVNLKNKEIEEILDRTGWIWEGEDKEKIVVTIPYERLDLKVKEDLIEEVGRIYGYEKIKSNLPDMIVKPQINNNFITIQKIRLKLADLGYSEVYNYAFVEKGEVKVTNPIASNKSFLRSNLKDGLEKSLEFNFKNAPFLGLDEIKIFEIGTVFFKDKEQIDVTWGSKNKKEVKIEEYSLEETLKKINIEKVDPSDLTGSKDARFKPISSYPFVLRDIAVWTPKGTKEKEVLKTIKKEAGELLVRDRLFDKFEKGDKVSYAFSLVFQSQEKTLTDSEINLIMEQMTTVINSQKGWQVR